MEAGASRVTVLGTKFTVRRDGDQVKVSVVDGRVSVSAAGASADSTGNGDAVKVIGRNDMLLAKSGGIVAELDTSSDQTMISGMKCRAPPRHENVARSSLL